MNKRNFTPKFKSQSDPEVLSGVRSASDACREYNLRPSVVSDWKATLLADAVNAPLTILHNVVKSKRR
jgi:transposase-like protein